MKKTSYILICAALAVSCSSFLDIRPEGTTTSISLDHSKSENIIKPISAAYAQLRSYDSASFPYIGCLEVTSDDADKGSIAEDGASMKALNEFRYDAANEYKALAEEGIGDAKFIRAYAYFRLVTMFGNIPVVDRLMTAEELASVKPSAPAAVWKFIEDDLADAIERLPVSWSKTYLGRVTRYSAMALKAKVHLYQGEYDQVAALCDEIIASKRYGLLDDFRSVFSVDQENSRESLFEIQSSDLGKSSGQAAYNTYAYVQGPRNNTPANMQGWGFCVPSEKLIPFFADRGETVRASTTFLYSGTTTPEGDAISINCPNPVYNGKVYTPSSYNDWSDNGYGYDYNIRILRYSDVLLMYAEALARGAAPGSKSGYTAQTALDEVRSRARLASVEPTLDNILDERRAEFAMEEDRFLDLVRTGKAKDVLGPLGYVEGKHNLFPIPSTQLQLNTNLKQNPNY